MPNFRYRALTQAGELVSGSIDAPAAAEVVRQVEYLGLVPIDAVSERDGTTAHALRLIFSPSPARRTSPYSRGTLRFCSRPVRGIDAALDLLANEMDIGRLRPIVGKDSRQYCRRRELRRGAHTSSDRFSRNVCRSGAGRRGIRDTRPYSRRARQRTAAHRSRTPQAYRSNALSGFRVVCGVLRAAFFLLFVLPNFASVLRDFNAKLDPIVAFFLALSDLVRHQSDLIAVFSASALAATWLLSRRVEVRRAVRRNVARLPLVKPLLMFHTTGLFCRNLGVLLSSGMTLSAALRILVQMMDGRGGPEAWAQAADRVRHGGKLSDALADADVLPAMAVRMLWLGEETGQLATLSGRIAEFYETKLQRSLDRIVGIAGPAAIIAISVVVGGLIVSVMTSLLSVTQIVGEQ